MFEDRKNTVRLVILAIGGIFLLKLFAIQVVSSEYEEEAKNNIVHAIAMYPYRGLIKARNEKLLVVNEPVYDVMVIPKEAKIKDSTKLARLFDLSHEEMVSKLTAARKYSSTKPSVFVPTLSNEDFAGIQSELVNYPGFYAVSRTVRAYPPSAMANALGYIGEISKERLKNPGMEKYKQGDFIGISGLEASYEEELRGVRGVKYVLVDVRGVQKGAFKAGEFDTLSEAGTTLQSTIDLDLQQYGEKLLAGKTGSIVAIEPKTGEILAIVSGPTYDPNLLAGGKLQKNYLKLQNDTLVPLYNRTIQAMYRPGSIFKLAQSLIALQEGVITPDTRIRCDRSVIACHGSHTNEDLKGAIKFSCNPYFRQVFKRIINQEKSSNTFVDSQIGLTKWTDYLDRMGFGRRLGIDIPNEKTGFAPTTEYYDRVYGKSAWKFSTIYSLSIGEGETLVTPLQMANLAAILANRGYYYRPHLIKPAVDTLKKHETGIDSKHFDVVISGMAEIIYGTGSRAAIPGVVVCGKTGTVQNVNTPDHAVFVAFAPMEDPQIAIAVYVEKAGWGGRSAATIAGLMMEKHIQGTIESPARKKMEDYVLKGEFLY